MVLTELLQNAASHGQPDVSEIVVRVSRATGASGERLIVAVEDDGAGLPDGFDLVGSTNLGLSIVRTLVETELNGRLTLSSRQGGPGTRAEIDVPL